ncbi:MAG TPA: rhomboid family intramembrane serine protease [Thermoguttaceae bacterium]|nr:rhomboid family intramembrane serine protease [Thermoguttaceae bacterium]
MFLLPLGDDVDHRDFPLVGVLLTVANVTIFLYMLRLLFGTADLAVLEAFCLDWGLVPAKLARGNVLGLLTHMFLHGGICHLLGNMLCLWAFVHTLEAGLGTVRLLALYLAWGIAGGLVHAAVAWGSDVPMIGASGAIAGMMGAYWIAFGPLTKIRSLVFVLWYPLRIDVPAGGFMAIWVLMQMLGAAESVDGTVGVAWFAHLGGFLAGSLTMVFLKKHAKTLVVTRHGDLEFVSSQDASEIPEEEPVPELEATPTACPHCGTSLGEEHQLAANLLRCPNPDCERCIYLEETAAAP